MLFLCFFFFFFFLVGYLTRANSEFIGLNYSSKQCTLNENISCLDLRIKIVLNELLSFDIVVDAETKVWKSWNVFNPSMMWVDIVERNYIKLNT